MAVQLFQKGTGKIETFSSRTFQHSLGNGWELTLKEALAMSPPEPEIEVEPDFSEDEDLIRQEAKKLGIRNWHNKRITRLIDEIGDIENGSEPEE